MKYRIIISIITSLLITSCCGSKNTASGIKVKKDQPANFVIDYYTSGGFTGRSEGLTIYSNGNVNFWSGVNVANSIIKDSAKINNDKINKFFTLLQDSTIFNFNYNEKGNLTTILNINSGKNKNRISYSGTVIPKEFPEKTKNLIVELNKLLNKK